MKLLIAVTIAFALGIWVGMLLTALFIANNDKDNM